MSSDSRILSAITAIKAEMIVKANNCSVFAVSVTASFITPKVGTEAVSVGS